MTIKNINTTEEYLKQMTDFRINFLKNRPDIKDQPFYKCIEHFVLENGQAYEWHPLPKKYSNKKKYGTIKQCFANATALSFDFPELTYVEGYASTVIPTQHAWCVDSEGRVIDPTWRVEDREEKYYPHGYFGVPISRKLLYATLARTERYGILDDWENDWPLLQKKFDPELWKDPDPIEQFVDEAWEVMKAEAMQEVK